MIEVEHAFNVLLPHGWENERAEVREANLAAVGVAGEHQVDEREAGMEDNVLNVVRLMAHEDDRGAGVGGNGEVEVGGARAGVVGAAEPEEIATSLECEIAVYEDGCSMGLEGRNDVAGAYVDVVVAEDAEALRSLEGGKDFGGDSGGSPGDSEGEGAAADEIAGDEDEVGGEAVDLGDHVLEEIRFSELFEVEIAHLDDAEVFEAVGDIADGDGESRDLELVARVGSRVDADTQACSGKGRPEKATAREMKGFWLAFWRRT